ncbi:hypothetical protein [Methylobacterium sp. yr596]|uniref:hypothetical protein n=1 Tax=Methylobacterium sp. yr596 TaxID=1761800 RepID=UPI0008ECA8DC|nr:hypothetical protein [Methylobacterium sp. yr596]SFF76749.1 hypothetical protein SAMN04487844_14712 [Methylobacterium sp. yr596]
MPRITLTGGAYQSRSVIASAQRSVNLFPEQNPLPGDAPVPVTHYPRPGLRRIAVPPYIGPCRALYTASNGDLYTVLAGRVFYINDRYEFQPIGQIVDGVGNISFADNGQAIVFCDGARAYVIDMASRQMGQITSKAFLGSAFVVYLDTFFVFHEPETAKFYISLSQPSYDNLVNGTIPDGATYAAFDPLDIARKAGSADNIVALATVHRELWVIGAQTSEVWANTGAADFAFQIVPGAFIDHGCAAPASVVTQDVSVFFLSKDRQGQGIVVQGQGYSVVRISTHAIEAEFQAYGRIDDAIGYCYQQQGHAFYVLQFPTANRTWAYELATKQWHELAWMDDNGGLNRHRARCVAFAYGRNLAGDWQNGTLYAIDPNVFTDDGRPILCLRTFPHLIDDGRRVSYEYFTADMQSGTLEGSTADDPPMLSLRYSDDRGASYSDPLLEPIGPAGDYLSAPTWFRLGMARDRVFELSWSAPIRTALNGAFIGTSRADS